MSASVDVHIENADVHFYIHNGGEDDWIFGKIQAALRRKWNWDDPAYLASTIFREIVRREKNEPNGFGISGGKFEDVCLRITVCCEGKLVRVHEFPDIDPTEQHSPLDVVWARIVLKHNNVRQYTFEEFVSTKIGILGIEERD